MVACFSGHYHDGGYSYEDKIHFLTLKSVLEIKENCYFRVDIF